VTAVLEVPDAATATPAHLPNVSKVTAPRVGTGDLRRAFRRGLLLLGLFVGGFLLYLFGVSTLIHARAQTGLERRFQSELANAAAPVNQPVAIGAPIAVLEIPDLGLHEVVIEGSTSTQLAKGPGHLRTSALPGQPGTSIVLCRRAAFSGPCGDLDALAPGDAINITTGQGVVGFRVAESRVYAASDARAFEGRGHSLVLVTMDTPYFGGRRLVIVAEPVGELQARGTRTPAAPLSADELGLAGDRAGAALLLVWLEVLALVAAAVVVLFRRWRRGSAYLIALPPLVASTWLVYEQLARLLPGTL
jgi:sortase A